ncbi:putative phage abortive infection protein [Flavobacterium adhaerens]|uniref:putative phage abortive infection protein n=1 Tax=Flavobacterium adhaerens TaxID=3149043 RepID=UPI0032B59FBF
MVGTVFALAGTILIFLSFNEQTKQNKREAFEATFFEMINLQRENVNQMNYTKFEVNSLEKAEHRKVFRIIFKEFLECYREVKKFSNSKNIDDYLLRKEKNALLNVISQNNLKINILELALVDIAYNIVFYGLSEEGEIILRDKFKRKYNALYFYQLLRYMKLKPKKENIKRWAKWDELMNLSFKDFKQTNLEFYNYRRHNSTNNLTEKSQKLVYTKKYKKYYGGHQHRLGHYFRHLFQTYKYLNYNEDLTEKEKYFYAKTLRAQLSTYEQALLFINSISSLGMKWELKPEVELLKKGETIENCKIITKYNLIKNLPGYHFFGIRYKNYYPKVKYETEE